MVYVKSGSATSVAANGKSIDQITGQYQFIGKGMLNFYALPTAVGIKASLKVNGISVIDDEDLIMFGSAGTLKKIDNLVANQNVAGGRVELFFRNVTGAAISIDWILEYTPTK